MSISVMDKDSFLSATAHHFALQQLLFNVSVPPDFEEGQLEKAFDTITEVLKYQFDLRPGDLWERRSLLDEDE